MGILFGAVPRRHACGYRSQIDLIVISGLCTIPLLVGFIEVVEFHNLLHLDSLKHWLKHYDFNIPLLSEKDYNAIPKQIWFGHVPLES